MSEENIQKITPQQPEEQEIDLIELAQKAGCHPCRRVRQTPVTSHRQRGASTGIPQHVETFLRGT